MDLVSWLRPTKFFERVVNFVKLSLKDDFGVLARAATGDAGDFSKDQIDAVCGFLKSEVSKVIDLPENVLDGFIQSVEANLRDSMAIRKPLSLSNGFIEENREYFPEDVQPISFLMTSYKGSADELSSDDSSWLFQGDIVVEFDRANLIVRVAGRGEDIQCRRDGRGDETVYSSPDLGS